ncbi:MAG: hypothetical protein QXG34_03840, partial [Candidatus Bathyarchaeia archaeon]
MASGIEEKIYERKELLKRAYSISQLFEIGKWLKIPYFDKFLCGWDMNEDEASMEIASRITDDALKQIFQHHKPRYWAIFMGKHYMLNKGKLSLEGSRSLIVDGIRRIKSKHGTLGISLLKAIVENDGMIDSSEIRRIAHSTKADEILSDLIKLGILNQSYSDGKYREWSIAREALPVIEIEIKGKPKEVQTTRGVSVPFNEEKQRIDLLLEEKLLIDKMDRELEAYVHDLLANRLEKTIRFGKTFNISVLSAYLRDLFGSVLYFDSLLSITQQYGLANVEIIHEGGKTGKRTGWSLALFGDPGTGKSFATRDMILGKPSAKIPAHGIPGRNRYCGGMTQARFIR